MQHPGLTGIGIRPINLEDYHRSISKEIQYVNDFDITDQAENAKLNQLLYTKYNGEVLDIVPTCECGETHGEEYVDTGYRCEVCGFEVTHVTERPLESVLWIKVPDGINAFISTAAWRKLGNMMHIPNFKTLNWLCDPSYRHKGNTNSKIEVFLSLNLPRGLNNFHKHFDMIIDAILNAPRAIIPADKAALLRLWTDRYKDRIFTKQLPVPSNLVFPVEKAAGTSTMYADEKMGLMLEAVRCINSISHRGSSVSDRVRNSRVVECIELAAKFYRDYYANNFGKKGGMFRKGLLGSRLDFTARAVASSIHGPHSYNEVHLPWGVACELFRLHITGMLIKAPYFMTPNEATELINRHIRTHHPILSELFDQIVGDGNQTWIILQRN